MARLPVACGRETGGPMYTHPADSPCSLAVRFLRVRTPTRCASGPRSLSTSRAAYQCAATSRGAVQHSGLCWSRFSRKSPPAPAPRVMRGPCPSSRSPVTCLSAVASDARHCAPVMTVPGSHGTAGARAGQSCSAGLPNTAAFVTIRDNHRRPFVFAARQRTALAEGVAAHLLLHASRLGLTAAGADAFLEDLVNHAGRPIRWGGKHRG